MSEYVTYGKCDLNTCDKKDRCFHGKYHAIFIRRTTKDGGKIRTIEFLGCGNCEKGGRCKEDIRYERKLKMEKLNEINS